MLIQRRIINYTFYNSSSLYMDTEKFWKKNKLEKEDMASCARGVGCRPPSCPAPFNRAVLNGYLK